MKHIALRGFLSSPFEAPPLLLQFQWNPTAVSESKAVKMNAIQVGGYHAPVQLYSSGGELVYRFRLAFDATADTQDMNSFRVDIPGVGVAGPIQILMSFLYPQTKYSLNIGEIGFGEPPPCYFGLGPRVLRGFIRTVNTSYSLYDKNLVPLRAASAVEFVASEDGNWGKVNAVFRRLAAGANLGGNF